jgi:hypothetical protein
MRFATALEDQSGYTLLETVMSMALFVSVLIPLGAAVGKLMLSDNSNTLHHALRIAESEICSTTPQNEVSGGSNTIIDGFVVEKDVTVDGNLVTVKVAVASVKKPAKSLVALQKTILVYR